mmetsp:Transcript_27053/g.92341  ORF Transcript_27053/g.92341 Transcript_27053/m.92341 type:complete len:416 (-) Transcript_27053:89-1336(-)
MAPQPASKPPEVNVSALTSEVRQALINQKSNACPMAVRLAWHSAGTFEKSTNTGGSDGATMRFAPESADPANAGLSIIQDLLHVVKKRHPEISAADLWTAAGSMAVGFLGGPDVPVSFGRADAPDGRGCPANGRLPDASQGAAHLRDVFGRMGFNDRETVALSGAHTLGRCHLSRSGFDGKWTSNPLRFDNEYFRNLVELEWEPRRWDGNFQYQDKKTGELMMLPTDMALVTDPHFRPFVELYAKDEQAFFRDFSDAFAKLLSLGTPKCPFRGAGAGAGGGCPRAKLSADFREAAMHGSEEEVKALAPKCDVHALEATSGRSALHKAAFWGHHGIIDFLLGSCKLDPNAQDVYGDTALHDAARFGHLQTCEVILRHKPNLALANELGQTPHAVAVEYSKPDVAALLARAGPTSKL